MADPYTDETPMSGNATRNLFLVAAGFGIGALVVLFGFVFLVGVGDLGSHATTPATPAAQSAANAPATPGPAPKPAPDTATPAVPKSTTGQGPAPANPSTSRAPTAAQTQK